jgi:DnaK suppressor protein
MSDELDIDVAAMKARLVALQEELRSLASDTEDSRKPVELDQTRVGRLSRMDAMQVQAMALETERRRQIEMQKIETALKRIEEDDYGWCVSCGEAIAPKRLEHDPAAPVCIDCAQGG